MSRDPLRIAIACLFALLFLAVFLYGWVTDDAFITFRVVRNFLAGDGPVYNLGERVQAYTHPLWFWLLSVGIGLGAESYHFALWLGYIFSAGFIVWLARLTLASPQPLFTALILFVVLGASETFLTFQTSGLESSLTALLILAIVVVSSRQESARDLLVAALLCSALLLNRLDQMFLVLPLAFCCFFTNPGKLRQRLGISLLGALPVIAWEAFSLVYYGFLFPNTKYAKLDARTTMESLYYGVHYIADFALFEPLQFVFILLVGIYLVGRYAFRRAHLFAIGLAILSQLLYVAYSGGDFMRGRFLHSSLILAAVAIPFLIRALGEDGIPRMTRSRQVGLITILLIAAGYGRLVVHERIPVDTGIHNERNVYKVYLAVRWSKLNHYRAHPWGVDARRLNHWKGKAPIAYFRMNGQRSFYVTSRVDLIDMVGLADAFVARCPATDTTRAGHFARAIPKEYLTERKSGQRRDGWKDPALEQLWRDIETITRSEALFSQDRFAAMRKVWRSHGM